MNSPKDRDALDRERRRRIANPTAYEVRHYGHRRAFAVWWTCPVCRVAVPPFEGHGHLR